MRRTNRVRTLTRTGAAVTAVLALAGVALAVPAPAMAASVVGAYGASVSFDSAGGTCSDVTDANSQGSLTSNGATTSKSASGNGVITDSGDGTDTTTVAGSAKATLRATESGGSFGSLTFSAALSASVNAAQGAASSCAAGVDASAGIESLITVTRGGWLTVTITAPSQTGASIQMMGSEGPPGIALMVQGDETSGQTTAWLDAGSYETYVSAEADAGLPGSGSWGSVSGTVKVTATMAEAGAAAGPATGSGAKYLSFAATRNCLDRNVAVTFTGAAKKLSKATLYVNGRKVRSLTNPPAQVSLILPVSSGDSAAVIKAVLVPDAPKGKKGKKPKKPKSSTVTRTYRACS